MLVRLMLVALLMIVVNAVLVERASASEWPKERQFLLVESPGPNSYYPPPSSVAETADGALLVLLWWTVERTSKDGSSTDSFERTRLVRIAPDGSRAFVPPFGEIDPQGDFEGDRITVDDEILPLPDGSILFTGYNAIDRRLADGSIVRFAGTGRYWETPSGDGGPATAADIGFAHGLTRLQDGSILFAGDGLVRRIAPDGTITTIAGGGPFGVRGDGGPATAAYLSSPSDVLPTGDGGFLIADKYNGHVREVGPDGVIRTVAGTDLTDEELFESSGDGGPATAAGLALPEHLARLPDGTLLIGGWDRIRQVSPDGAISTLLDLAAVSGNRVGDFAGRHDDTIEAMEVTAEGGIAVIVSGVRLRALYLAPPETRRVLVGIRDASVSQRRVKVTVDTTQPGRAQLQIRRGGRVVTQATRHIAAGRQTIAADGRFAAAYHDVRVTLRADGGGHHRDSVRLFTSATLPERLVIPTLYAIEACKRITARRIDCEIHVEEDEEDGRNCLVTNAYRLVSSGILFRRSYGRPCHRQPRPFDRTPDWSGPWSAWPVG